MTATATAAASSKYTPSTDLVSFAPNLVGGMWNNMRDRLTLYAEIEQRKIEYNNKMRIKAMRQLKKQANKARQKLAKYLTELNHAILFDIIRIDVDQQSNTGDSARFARIELKNLKDVPAETEEAPNTPTIGMTGYGISPQLHRTSRNAANTRRWAVTYDVGVTSTLSNEYKPIIQYTAYEMSGGSRTKQFSDADPSVVMDQLLRWIAAQSLFAKGRWDQPTTVPTESVAPAATSAAAVAAAFPLPGEAFDGGQAPVPVPPLPGDSGSFNYYTNDYNDYPPANWGAATSAATNESSESESSNTVRGFGSFGGGTPRRVAATYGSRRTPVTTSESVSFFLNTEGSSADGSV